MEIAGIYIATTPAVDTSEMILSWYMFECTFVSALMGYNLCLLVHDMKERRVIKRDVLRCVCTFLLIVQCTTYWLSIWKESDYRNWEIFCSAFYPQFDGLAIFIAICGTIVWLKFMMGIAADVIPAPNQCCRRFKEIGIWKDNLVSHLACGILMWMCLIKGTVARQQLLDSSS
jgi:hypothetical protein